VIRVLEDYEVSEEELYSHIGIFLDNNQNLLRKHDGTNDVSREQISQEDSQEGST